MGVRTEKVKVERKGPLCPNHEVPMVFDSVHNFWRCVTAGCPMIAHPKKEYNPDRPTVLDGPTEVVIQHPETRGPNDNGPGLGTKYFVRHVDTNTLIDITSMLLSAEVGTSGVSGRATLILELKTDQWIMVK